MNFKNVLLLTTVTWLISDIECNTTTVAIPDPCQDYTVLDSNSRQHTIQGNNGLCDNNLNEGWYKLEINGRAAEIPNVCLQHDVCGTRLPLRIDLEGNSMPVVGVTLEAYACTSYEVLGQWDCCVLRQPVTIKNCRDFYVYHLIPTDRCPVAYCAQEIHVNPSDQITRKRGDSINNIVLSSTTTMVDMATSGSNITETTTGIPMKANTTSVSGSSSVSSANAGLDAVQNMTTTVTDYSTESYADIEQSGNTTTDSTLSNPTSGNIGSTLPLNNLTITESSTVSAAENATDVSPTAGNDNVTIATEAQVESITENVTVTEQTTVVSGIVDDNNGTNVSSTVNTTNRTGLPSRSTTVSTQRTTTTALECTNWPQVNCTERNTTCYVSPSNNENYIVCADGSACGVLCDSIPDCADENDEKICPTGMICSEGRMLCTDRSGCFNRCDGHVTCNTMAPGEDEDGCPTKPTISPALTNTTFTNASLASTTQLGSGSSSSVTTVSPSTVPVRSTDDQTTNATTTQQASPTTPTSGSPTTPTSGSPTTPTSASPTTPTSASPTTPTSASPSTPTSGSPTTPTSASPTTPTSASPMTPVSSSAASGPISSTSAPIPTSETFSSTDADNMTATLNNTIGGLSTESNTIATPPSTSSSDTSTNATINTKSTSTFAGSSTYGSPPSSPSSSVLTSAGEQTSSQTAHTQSMTTTEPEGSSLSTHALTSESTERSSQSTTESVESTTGTSPDSHMTSARPSSSQTMQEQTTDAASMVITTIEISTHRLPVASGSSPSGASTSTEEVKQSTSTSTSSSAVLTTENTVAESAVSSTSAPPSSGTESESAVSTESRTQSTVITAGDVSRTDSVSTSGPTISSSTERGTVTDSRNASAEFSSVTGSQPTSSAENQTETDHTVYLRKEKKGLYYENFGLFVFLIVAGAVIAGVCMFGVIGYAYQRRLRTWNPTMSYQDAYGDLEKTNLSFGRDKHGIESPIPDFDILRDEKHVEETSLSQASTLALCATPGKTEPPFDDSYDDVVSPSKVTNGKPPNGGTQQDNEVSYIANGNTNEGFVADDNVDGIVPVDDLDTSAPRALFPWIENAADTKL